jgi:hypothetical protein
MSAALAVTVLVAAAGMPGNEYSTAAFGRWHLTPMAARSGQVVRAVAERAGF